MKRLKIAPNLNENVGEKLFFHCFKKNCNRIEQKFPLCIANIGMSIAQQSSSTIEMYLFCYESTRGFC